MKRTPLAIVLLLIVLTAGVSAMERSDRPRPRMRPPGPETRDQGAILGLQNRRLQEQINNLENEHKALIGELQAIKALAAKDNATDVADRVQALIGKRQKAFDSEMEALKARQKRIQRAVRQEGIMQPPTGEAKKAPDFELTSFGGKTIKLSDYKDKIVVLEWLNMQCPFSRYHHETKNTMVELAKKYKDKAVVWLGVNSTNFTTPEANIAFAKKQKLPYPILDDRAGTVGRAFGARTTPDMFVIDHGTIIYNGAIDNAPMGRVQGGGQPINYVDQVLAKLTTGQKVEPTNHRSYGCAVKYKAR